MHKKTHIPLKLLKSFPYFPKRRCALWLTVLVAIFAHVWVFCSIGQRYLGFFCAFPTVAVVLLPQAFTMRSAFFRTLAILTQLGSWKNSLQVSAHSPYLCGLKRFYILLLTQTWLYQFVSNFSWNLLTGVYVCPK